MAIYRFKAIEETLTRQPIFVEPPSQRISDFFGENVFNEAAMQEFLPDDAYKKVMEAMAKGSKIDRKVADQVASSMKAWAMSKGASHYTHWFQPLTGATAEKHDAFFDPLGGGRSFEKFEGSELVQQEPDASSFPSGGIRNTFEARGYTAWDPTSPAFIIGRTLCIPTIFVSYTGEALDFKTPLLKTIHALDKAATKVCQYFDKNVTNVKATLGWEQEYFLIDSALYNARPDLVLTGRTVFGRSSSKGQQLDDHYFGSIPERARAYMRDFETEALKLGIPVKTRHNEVAPNQFECAPVFEDVNHSVDHNQLIMDVMEKVARRHNFRVLLHEKPFAGMNGSGKHNNWSMASNTGVNLLAPGKNPKSNLQFLTFFANAIKAVHDYSDLLRAAVATPGNDHRLGANEAPPAIISIFAGTQLSSMLDEIESTVKGGKMTPEEKTELKLNIGRIPEVMLDNTDRNRTSPFAFTGNKFEFRAVGSSANCASAMIVINTIMAKQLKEFKKEVDVLIKGGLKKDEAIFQVLRKTISSSKKIRFEGDNYSAEWAKEAQKRGLANIKSTPHALGAYVSDKSLKLFKEMGVMRKRELLARNDIAMENYQMKIEIESRVVEDLALNYVIPVAIKYQNELISNVRGLKEIFGSGYKNHAGTQVKMITEISEKVTAIMSNIDAMVIERGKADKVNDIEKMAIAYCDNVLPYFEKIRVQVDRVEQLVEDDEWPLPKYREMLFTK